MEKNEEKELFVKWTIVKIAKNYYQAKMFLLKV